MFIFNFSIVYLAFLCSFIVWSLYKNSIHCYSQ